MGLEELRRIKSGKDRSDRGAAKKEKQKEKSDAKKQARKTPLKKGYSLKTGQRSEKMKGVIAALRPLYDRFLSSHPDCEIRSEVCTGPAECVHHTQGRGIKVILDDSKWKASCTACNTHVENKDQEAREKGNKVSRLSKH